jgi:hypothetical protein
MLDDSSHILMQQVQRADANSNQRKTLQQLERRDNQKSA